MYGHSKWGPSVRGLGGARWFASLSDSRSLTVLRWGSLGSDYLVALAMLHVWMIRVIFKLHILRPDTSVNIPP